MKKRLKKLLVSMLLVGSAFMLQPAHAQTDPFIGQMMLFAGNFCPRGWARAEGQELAISSNSALFSILGTAYGGDGRTNFKLPDLRGRVPIGQGQGPGLPNYNWGEKSGDYQTVLNQTNLPSHSHSTTITVRAAEDSPNTSSPSGAALAESQIFNNAEAPSENAELHADTLNVTVGNTGNNMAFNNVQPYLGMYWCINLDGVFPSRSNEALPNE